MNSVVLSSFFKEAGALGAASKLVTVPVRLYGGAMRAAPATTAVGTVAALGGAGVAVNRSKAEEARRKAYPRPNKYQVVRRPNPAHHSKTGLY